MLRRGHWIAECTHHSRQRHRRFLGNFNIKAVSCGYVASISARRVALLIIRSNPPAVARLITNAVFHLNQHIVLVRYRNKIHSFRAGLCVEPLGIIRRIIILQHQIAILLAERKFDITL